MNTPLPTEQTLAQQALEKVRALCRGNGVRADSITIDKHDIAVHTLHAATYLELKPVLNERVAPGKISSGQMASSRDEVLRMVDQEMRTAASSHATKLQMAGALLNRADKGFGLNQQVVPLDFIKKEFTYHERCNTCQASGTQSCLKCHGRKVESCTKCSGRGLMICPQCRATGLLQGVKCTRCHGQRYVPCDLCHRSGNMPCRSCNGSGTMKCQTCGGAGWKSHVVTMGASAVTYFEYDPKSIPQWAADMVESDAPDLVRGGKIKIDGRMADDKENVLGASYEATFPYGEMTFLVGKKDFVTGVFGYQAELVNFPNVLDKLVQKGIDDLEDAAADRGSVAGKIRKATRYRLIAQGVLMAVRLPPKKAIEALTAKYPDGLSGGMVEKIILLAEQATAHITRKPKRNGLLLGLAGMALALAAYYLLPVRSALADLLPDKTYSAVLDILPVILGGVLCTLSIQMAAARSMTSALGHLIRSKGKKTLLPKAGRGAYFGYAGTALLCLLMMELAVQAERAAPLWYVSFRALLE